MKIRGVMGRKGDTPDYARRMQQDLFDFLAMARSLDASYGRPMVKEVREKYMQELESVDIKSLLINRRISRLNYSRRCEEASAVQAYQKCGLPLSLAPSSSVILQLATRLTSRLLRPVIMISAFPGAPLGDPAFGYDLLHPRLEHPVTIGPAAGAGSHRTALLLLPYMRGLTDDH
jgi:hypothetical protein